MQAARLKTPLFLALLVIMGSGLSGCVGAVLGAGASVGVAASEERGIGGSLTDTRIQVEINDKWLKSSIEMFRKIDMTVHEGRVLLTGTVDKPDMRLEAVKLVWQVDGVREVINEIKVSDTTGGATDYARDVLISTQLRSAILFDRNVRSVNYSVETVDGVVFLMGVAQNPTELERVTNYARNLRYVQRVVSYVRIKTDPPPMPSQPQLPPITRVPDPVSPPYVQPQYQPQMIPAPPVPPTIEAPQSPFVPMTIQPLPAPSPS